MRPLFLRSLIQVEPFLGSGASGPTYGTAVTVRASVQPDIRLVIDGNGREVQAQVTAIVWPDVVAPPESRITADGKVYRVLVDSPYPDTARPDHRELLLGSFA